MNKHATIINITASKRQRNLPVTLGRKNLKSFLNSFTKTGITAKKKFWTFAKPFLTNKDF